MLKKHASNIKHTEIKCNLDCNTTVETKLIFKKNKKKHCMQGALCSCQSAACGCNSGCEGFSLR